MRIQLPSQMMVDQNESRGSLVIYISIVIGLILQVLPLPVWADQLRPDWSLLILIYWGMALPQRVGIFSAFIIGLFADVVINTPLGQHALAYAVIIFVVIKLHKRLRLIPMWQQTLSILALVSIERLIAAIILGVTRGQTPDGMFWMTPAISLLLWPWLFILLRDARRKFRVK